MLSQAFAHACSTPRPQSMLRQFLLQWIRAQGSQQAKETIFRHAPTTATEPTVETPSAAVHVAILFALKIEAGGFLDLLSGVVTERANGFVLHEGGLQGKRVQVVITGPGRAAAAQATQAVIDAYHPRWIVSSGLAGGLKPELGLADIVVVNSLTDGRSGQRLQLDLQLAPGPRLHLGRLVTVEGLVKTTSEKKALAEQFGAVAVDLESFAVAQVCQLEKTRFLCIRAISDTVEDELPADLDRLMQQKSWPGKLGAVTGSVFRRPGSVKDLWRLRENALVAGDRLAAFLKEILAQLGPTNPES